MKNYPNPFLITIVKIAISVAIVLAVAVPFALYAQQGNNVGLSQAGRNSSCVSGLRTFMAAGIGYESFTDYFRDFKMWPSQYADVMAVEQQVNKARYAVVAAFLRCDMNQLKVVSDNYYKLEAELYFVRHVVDTSIGSTKNLALSPEDRQKFIEDMTKFFILRKKSQDKDADSAVLAGYFEEFSKKYEEKVKQYSSFTKDPSYKDLSAKFDELIKSFKSITKVGDGLKSSGEPKEKPAKPEKGDAKDVLGTSKTLTQKAGQVFAKLFNACITTPNDRYCIGGSTPPSEPIQQTPGKKQTFDDVMFAVQQQKLLKTKDLDKVEMLTRYEILYGDVNGGGMEEVLRRLDTLKGIITTGANVVPGVQADPKKGSFAPLVEVNKCASLVLRRECK